MEAFGYVCCSVFDCRFSPFFHAITTSVRFESDKKTFSAKWIPVSFCLECLATEVLEVSFGRQPTQAPKLAVFNDPLSESSSLSDVV